MTHDTDMKPRSGGCLCGALRYEAQGAPLFAGHCYCADCRKASGSGFIPFMTYAGSLDDASLFRPTIAIFTRGRPDWAVVPPGLTLFETLPG